MKNIFLVHGYNGIPKIYNWLEKELADLGYNVIVPTFPAEKGVIYEDWKKIFNPYAQYIEESSIVVAHSIGNEFIIKYFNEKKLKIDTYISLAGFSEYFELENREDLNRAFRDFIVSKTELEQFKKMCNKRYSIYSNDDHIVPFEVLEKYPISIEAKALLIKNIGHMGRKSGLEKIPEVLEIIKESETK